MLSIYVNYAILDQLTFNEKLYIASEVLNRSKNDLIVNGFVFNNHMYEIAYDYVVNKRPLSKIFNKKEFMNYVFLTNEYTLDPRPETEQLVQAVIDNNHDNCTILDLGIGTGAILLSLMRSLNNIEGIGIDIKQETLNVCRKNAECMQLKPLLIENDWLRNFEKKVNVLVSNPPYLLQEEIIGNYEVLRYDPYEALYGGEDGLYFYQEIATKHYLFDYIYLEVPFSRYDVIKNIFSFRQNVFLFF